MLAAAEPTLQEAPPCVSRLVMQKMVLSNFKSYQGEITIGPFHKSFSSIVGPNGSGKSNVIDALLFVFGFKAKKLRQTKLGNLIHNSSNFQNLTSASVSVCFTEIIDLPEGHAESYTVVPNSELVITRTVEKTEKHDGSFSDKSYYKINGRMSNFTEVTSLLKEKGVDLDHKRFLILQGEVESIAQMKPKAPNEHEDGLLEYLEDIIGTSKYKTNIQELNNQVEEFSVERSNKLQKAQLVEKEMKGLEGKKCDAVEYIEAENNLAIARSQYFQLCLFELSSQFKDLETKVAERTVELQAEKESRGHLSIQINELTQNCAVIESEYDAIASEAESVEKKLQKYERAQVEIKEKEKHFKQKEKKLSKTIHGEKMKLSENESWVKNFTFDLNKQERELSEVQKKLAVEEEVLAEIQESLQDKTSGFQQDIEKQQLALQPWTAQISTIQNNIKLSTSEYDILMNKLSRVEVELRDANQGVAELKVLKMEKEVASRDVLGKKAQLEKELAELSGIYDKLCAKESRLKQTVQSSSSQIESIKTTLLSAQSQDLVLTSLLQQNRTGKLPGVCGKLGDLGIIDAKYDVAITTACGALKNIVVETVENGQSCIEHLKKQQLGRATFLCLDKLSSKPAGEFTPQEKGVHRLFDLITFKEPKFSKAFYHVLGDTLVCETLEQANRIAYGGGKRYKVVTLDGQMIEVSGVMSGGGNKPSRGGMSNKFVLKHKQQSKNEAEDVVKLEKERDTLEVELKAVQAEKKEVDGKIKELKKEEGEMEVEVAKVEMDVKSIQQKISDALKIVKDLENYEKPDESDLLRVKTLKKQIAEYENKLTPLQLSASQITSKISQLQEKILEVGGVKLRMAKTRVDSLSDQVTSYSQALTKLKVEKGTREKEQEKLSKSLAKKEEELEILTKEIDVLADEMEEQRVAAASVRDSVAEAKLVLDVKEKELADVKKVLEQKSDKMNEIRKAEVEIKQFLDEAKKKLNAHKSMEDKFKNELASLKIQAIGLEEDEEVPELEEYVEHELQEMKKDTIKATIIELEKSTKASNPNLEVLQEYRNKLSEYQKRAHDLEQITLKRDQAKLEYDQLRQRRLDEFMAGFTLISLKLKEMYQMITLGGNAELELVDSLDPFSEGIIFSVMPPKKSWKNISNLSGGEKTLSSLALVFALHHFKPTPIYVMDEIDAALDFRNVSIVASYIKERTKNGQFIIISLRNNMFELADRLVGIYKTDNTTKSITINPQAISMAG